MFGVDIGCLFLPDPSPSLFLCNLFSVSLKQYFCPFLVVGGVSFRGLVPFSSASGDMNAPAPRLYSYNVHIERVHNNVMMFMFTYNTVGLVLIGG